MLKIALLKISAIFRRKLWEFFTKNVKEFSIKNFAKFRKKIFYYEKKFFNEPSLRN